MRPTDSSLTSRDLKWDSLREPVARPRTATVAAWVPTLPAMPMTMGRKALN